MQRSLSEAKLFASHQHQRIIGIDVRLAVAAAVEHDRVVEHPAIALRRVRQFRDELRQQVCLELVVTAEFVQMPATLHRVMRQHVVTCPETESDRNLAPLGIHAL
jgi:hypothetical protein